MKNKAESPYAERKVNPVIDCVFKKLLGDEKKKHLTIHFLNLVLEYHDNPKRKIIDITILNPYNEREFETDKLCIVDVKVLDASDRHFIIEMQLTVFPSLTSRMLYTWSTVYHSSMEKGDDYTVLKPVISIWIVKGAIFNVEAHHLPFYAYNAENKLKLNDHFAIHVLQLPKWKIPEKGFSEKDRWLYLFKEGKNVDVDNPPAILKESKEMRDAMETLRDFSEKQKDYLLYQDRVQAEMLRRMIEKDLENTRREMERERKAKEKEREAKEKERKAKEKEREAKEKERQAKEKEREAKEKERKEKEEALTEIERLKKLLDQAGRSNNGKQE